MRASEPGYRSVSWPLSAQRTRKGAPPPAPRASSTSASRSTSPSSWPLMTSRSPGCARSPPAQFGAAGGVGAVAGGRGRKARGDVQGRHDADRMPVVDRDDVGGLVLGHQERGVLERLIAFHRDEGRRRDPAGGRGAVVEGRRLDEVVRRDDAPRGPVVTGRARISHDDDGVDAVAGHQLGHLAQRELGVAGHDGGAHHVADARRVQGGDAGDRVSIGHDGPPSQAPRPVASGLTQARRGRPRANRHVHGSARGKSRSAGRGPPG